VRVLVVDPDRQVRQRLAEAVRQQSSAVEVLTAASGAACIRLSRVERPDVVVLATGVNDRPAFEVLRDLRRLSDAPVLLLARNGSEAEHIEGLRLGADDYIAQPVSGPLLAARIEAIRRRGGLVRADDEQPDFRSGALSIWARRQLVSVRGVPLGLTPLEYRLLYQLILRAGEVVPTQVLLDRVWGDQYGATSKYLKVFVNRLRSKLGQEEGVPTIVTQRRVGYRLVLRSTGGASSSMLR
jgi:DNA-binding response OmpR family regulator